jgi:predicted phage gp36 major capsid-like protein
LKALLAVLALCAPLMADLEQVRAEPNLEKRAAQALDYADRTLKDARRLYADGDAQQAEKLLDEVGDAVELAEKSLKETRKDPIRSPRHFKNAEIKTRGLLRSLDAFTRDMNAADRPMTDKVKERVQEVHDRLLQGIMTGKSK